MCTKYACTRPMISHVAPVLWLDFSETTENPLPKCQALLSNLTSHTKSTPNCESLNSESIAQF